MTTIEGDASVTDSPAKIKTRSEMVREIRNSDATYFIKNNMRQQFVVSSVEPPLSLGPAGRGEDVAILPKDILNVPGVQRMWAAGKITITDDESVETDMIESVHRESIERQKSSSGAEIEEPASNRDLIEKRCLVSGEKVYQTQADIKNMVPPLAPEHKNRAHEFTPTVSSDGQGNEVVKFSKAVIEKE